MITTFGTPIRRRPLRLLLLVTCTAAALFCPRLNGQTPSTGALLGVVLDPSGAVVPGSIVRLINPSTGAAQSVTSDGEGRFRFLLLPPGKYQIQAGRTGFDDVSPGTEIEIAITETVRVELSLQLETLRNGVVVVAKSALVDTESSALGKIVGEEAVTGLPLVTRNFSQIAGLPPGVATGVNNAGELGLGGAALSQIANSNDGLYVHGARSYDNNFQLDGISISDVQGSAAGSGGIPIPNPDTIEEFKVQTGLYDAAYGRYAGANVNLTTKTGSNDFHATLFEFIRNELLNANDFFLNRTGQRRPVLKQNQFGIAAGGPIKKQKLFFFGSYQGTRQINGIAAGQSRIACTASLSEPPLTDNNRTPVGLGKMFGGMSGMLGGTAVKPDGSNINPAAIALLNRRLADGTFLIPNPQSLDSTRPLVQQGFSVFTDPCRFNENQALANVDAPTASRGQMSAHFFSADSAQTVTFPGNGLNAAGNVRGFLSPGSGSFRVFSLAHRFALGGGWINEARIGYVRTRAVTEARTPFRWSDVGIAEGEMSRNNELPSLKILGSISFASGFPRTITQNSYVFDDGLNFARGAQTLRLGGSISRLQDNIEIPGLGSFIGFLSWPDFLIGRDARGSGSGFGNVFASFDDFGLTERQYRALEAAAFAQVDSKIGKSLTVNLGLRFEHLGQFGDKLGRNSSFDISRADPNPPPAGSVAGYVVASNFRGNTPPGVLYTNNASAGTNTGQDTMAPRIGFAWKAISDRLVVRGGYGSYYSRPTGQAFYQNVFGAPFSQFRINMGMANAGATLEEPFGTPFPTPQSFPFFPSYSPTTVTTIYSVAHDFRPAMIRHQSLGVQAEPHKGWLLDVAYFSTRGVRLLRQRSLNQALAASAVNPVRGQVQNTVANIPFRVPIPGVPPDSLLLLESGGNSWYNGLEASLSMRSTRGSQLLISYTFSKTLDTDGSDVNSTSSGNALPLGDQNSPGQRRGRASFDRTHRLVVSSTWPLPSPRRRTSRALFGNWSVAVIGTVQSGTALTIAETNAMNVFGISEDRAQLSGKCSNGQLVNIGNTQSKLNHYFNGSCFANFPIIGADGIGTAFGNSPTGVVNGPRQANVDLALAKQIAFNDETRLQVRAEFYNAFNHPQFANPDSNRTSATFGVIANTAVNARVGQLAIKFVF